MKRNDPRYHREFNEQLHHNDRTGGNYDRDQAFDNYRDRYSNRHGNYYGMPDQGAAYDNVRSSNPDPNYGYRSGGPVAGYGASSYRGVTESGDHYHYGDPNPHMGNNRNEQSGGYERKRGTGWGAEDNYVTYGAARGTNYSAGSGGNRYNRQDNSYRAGGSGRRYEDFNRDENKKMYRGRADHGYNMLGIDAYYDRGEQKERRSDNDFRGMEERNDFGSEYEKDDFRYQGEIHDVNRNRDYGAGSHDRNRYHDDYSQRSSRYRQSGETSGPDYRAHSGLGDFGQENIGL